MTPRNDPLLHSAVSRVVCAYSAACHKSADLPAFQRLLADPKLGLTPAERNAIRNTSERRFGGWDLGRGCAETGRRMLAASTLAELWTGAALKSALLTRLKSRAGPRPITASEALYEWYYRGVDADNRLTPKSKLMLSWLCVLASSQDLAPLWYEISEIGRKFGWPDEQTRQHAGEAAAAGCIELDGSVMILTDPRSRRAA